MAADITVTLVTEDLGTYSDGSPRFQVGYEQFQSDGRVDFTNKGWECRSPAEGFVRVLSDELKQAENLMRAAGERLVAVHALVEEVAKLTSGIELRSPDWPSRHVVSGTFGSTRIEQVETQRDGYQTRLMDGHRCEHHRTCLDNCSYCPGYQSVGGPACSFDDKILWADFENGRRR